MKYNVITLLTKLEQDKDIKIMYACEAGSRAWGFPSPDSDYDIRFIYRHPRSWYLSLQEKKDTIEFMENELLDGNGWDIRKVLRLLYKSNASLYEWLFSPIVYIDGDQQLEELRQLAGQYFQPKRVMHHYLGIARGMLDREFKGPQVKIKKYFYVIRPVLAARWIADQAAPPPVDFHDLLPLVKGQKDVYANIQNLLAEKEHAAEGQLTDRIAALDNFIQKEMERLENVAKVMERQEYNYKGIDAFYRKYILQLG